MASWLGVTTAIGYLLNHIRQLSRYTTDGRYRIGGNPIGTSVRPLALGRKSYLFRGNHDATEASAVIYALIGCCNIAGVDVRAWLKYFLTHIHDYYADYSGGSHRTAAPQPLGGLAKSDRPSNTI